MQTLRTLAAAAVMAVAVSGAQAELLKYGTEGQWDAALKANSRQNDFLSIPQDETPPFVLSGIGGTLNSIAGDNVMVEFNSSNPDLNAGRKPKTGSTFLESNGSFEIVFTESVAAFGFWASDIGDFDSACTAQTCPTGLSLTLHFLNSNGTAGTEVVPVDMLDTRERNGGLFFFGFTQDSGRTYSKITFTNLAPGRDYQGFDDFSTGAMDTPPNGTPEPGTLALLGMAAFGAAGFRRRRGN